MNWNHVEIKLPPVNEKVLVVTRKGKYAIAMRYVTAMGEERWNGTSSFAESIVAWMPLPSCSYIYDIEMNGIKVGDVVEIKGQRCIVESLTSDYVFAQSRFGSFVANYSIVKKI